MKSTKKHFLFDLDDTLIDSHEYNQQRFVDVFEAFLDIKDKKIEEYLRALHFRSKGTSMYLQFAEAKEHFGLSNTVEDLLKINDVLQEEKMHEVNIFDATEDMLKLLRNKNRKVSILSNRQSKTLEGVLRKKNLYSYFSNVISCVDAGYEKPDPYCLNKLVADSKEPKSDFIYFGDSKTDAEFARAAEIDYIIIDQYINQKKFFKMILQSFII